MPEHVTSATFAPLLGQAFVATPGRGEPVELVLSACDEAPHLAVPGAGGSGRVPFSLLFHARDGRYLEQQIFTVRHPDLGDLPVFLVPLGPDDGGMRYEAVFS